MCGTEMRKNLTLTPVVESSCACCSTDASTSQATTAAAVNEMGTVFELAGLTCGSCVQRVEKAVNDIAGVDSASVSLVSGGASSLRVVGTAAPELVSAAVVAAGYTVA